MKLTKENVCVFIENEQQLEEARKMLEKYGESIFEKWFIIEGDFDNLFFDGAHWWIGYTPQRDKITLQQLEEILKQSK